MSIWTEDDVTELKAAIKSGILTVKYSGPPAREITYQNLNDMKALLAEMLQDTDPDSRPRFRKAKFTKGFDE